MFKIKVYAGHEFVGYITKAKSNEPVIFKNHAEAYTVADQVNRESSFGLWYELEKVG